MCSPGFFYFCLKVAKNYFTIISKTPTQEISNVVYLVRCKTCNLKYIGQTGNIVRVHINNRRIKLAEHVKLIIKYEFDLEHVEILQAQQKKYKREMIEILNSLSTFRNSK